MWNNANEIFPTGFTPPLPNGEIITTDELQQRDDIHVISFTTDILARTMKIQSKTQVWGENGEYAEGTDYDIYFNTFHPDSDYYPLNVYGQSMVNNYYYYNNTDS